MKRLTQNNQCLITGCTGKLIGSHVIAESVLERIAEKGHVLTWDPEDADIAKNARLGLDQETVYQQPTCVGIRSDVTYPLFCDEHDGSFFRELEYRGFSCQIEQVALLAYRAACYKTWNARWEEKQEYLLSSKEPEIGMQYKRLFSREIMVEARQRLYGIIETKDYQQLSCKIISLNVTPFIACTEAFIPYIDGNEAAHTANGIISPKAEDVIAFSFFPDIHSDKSFCVLSWFRDSQRVSEFIDSYHLDQLAKDDLVQMLYVAAIQRSLVYVSPIWWRSLSPELQGQFSRAQIANALAVQNLFSDGGEVQEIDDLGDDASWTDEDMTRLAEITPEELVNASALWDQAAPAELKGLLGAPKE
jgi:hypothetical protein